jgi:putative transposase
VVLTPEQRAALHCLVRRHSTAQQIALRAGIILDAAEGMSNTEIARVRQVTRETVIHWRDRWTLFQPIPLAELSIEDRLADAPPLRQARAVDPPTDLRDRRHGVRGPEPVGAADHPLDPTRDRR